MEESDIHDRIVSLLVENFSIKASQATSSATFRGTLGLDSLDVVDLIFFVQQEFSFKAKTAEFRDLKTMANLVAFVEQKTRQ